MTSWNTVVSNQNIFSQEEEMRRQASQTTAFLVSTPGFPEDWENDSVDVEIPGFADPDQVLQGEKLEEFGELSYDTQRSLLKAENFNLSVRNESGVIGLSWGEPSYGRSYEGAETIISFRRNVRVNSSNGMKSAELKYVVWR